VPTSWEVQGWKFSGMSKAGVYSERGKGDTPPASAFK
jgi:hypothetical protein